MKVKPKKKLPMKKYLTFVIATNLHLKLLVIQKIKPNRAKKTTSQKSICKIFDYFFYLNVA